MAEQAERDGWTYRQEYVRCGAPGCWCRHEAMSRQLGRPVLGHGPYWYRYRREGDRVLKRYVGKRLPWEQAAPEAACA